MKNHLLCTLLFLVQQISLAFCAQLSDDMQARYNALDSLASCYKRPFTVVEVAACTGDYSLSLAKKYTSAVCVMIDGNEPNAQWADQLFSRCKQSRLSNIILLGSLASAAQIERLGECEHFDLVFSFRAIERAGDAWQELVDGLITLGDHLIVEVPDNKSFVPQYIRMRGAQPITKLSASMLYYIPCKKETLKRKTWLRTLESTIKIKSTFTEKKLIKKTPYHQNILTSDWKPGINLITFKMCGGMYPELSTVKKALAAIKYVRHNDWAMHNIIMQGSTLTLIDYADPRMQGRDQSRSYAREQLYQKIVQCIELKKPQDVEAFFWKYLKRRPEKHGFKKFFKTIFHAGQP